MLEEKIEAYLVKRVKELGGVAEKFVSPGKSGVPDRIVMLPGGLLLFVECKATGKKAAPAQQRDHDRRRALGFGCYVVDSFAAIDAMIESEFGFYPDEKIGEDGRFSTGVRKGYLA